MDHKSGAEKIDGLVIEYYCSDPCIISVIGNLNIYNANRLYREYERFKREKHKCKNLIVDFSKARPYNGSYGISFDTSVVSILLQFREEIEKRKGKFRFRMHEDNTYHIFEFNGVGETDFGA